MADDTAHIAHGPEPDPVTAAVDASTDGVAEPAADIVSERAAPSFAEYTEAIGADVEVMGRRVAPVAGVEQVEPVAVLVGAASGPHGDHVSSGASSGVGPAQPPAPSGSGILTRDEPPPWSFRDRGPRSAAFAPQPDRTQVELPFAPVEERPAPTARPLPMFGPVGRARSTLLVPLLAVASLGGYALVWHHRVNRELEEFDPKLRSRPGRSTIAVVVPWLLGLLVTLCGAALIVTTRLSVHIPFDTHLSGTQAYFLLAGLLAVPYLTLVLPFSLMSVVMTLERVRCVEEHLGSTTDRQVRPVATSLLLAIPVVGGLILLAAEQARINAIWSTVAPSGFLSR